MHRTLLSASMVVLSIGCRSTEPSPSAPASTSAPTASSASLAPPSPSTPTSAAASAADTALGLASLPDLGSRKKLMLHQGQGGPKLVRCNGVVYNLELDIATSDWTYSSCEADGRPGSESAPLVTYKGRLSKADRAKVEATYQSLRVIRAPRCADDAGLFVLELRGSDGGTERYSCREPVGVRADALALTLMEIVNASRFP